MQRSLTAMSEYKPLPRYMLQAFLSFAFLLNRSLAGAASDAHCYPFYETNTELARANLSDLISHKTIWSSGETLLRLFRSYLVMEAVN